MLRALRVLAALAVPAAAGCAAWHAALPAASALPASRAPATPRSPIQHVVIVVQENRTFNDFFAIYPGADGTTTGKIRKTPRAAWANPERSRLKKVRSLRRTISTTSIRGIARRATTARWTASIPALR